ncbi:MAG TPA: hypothetical protein VFR23_13970 [Jiangellaceae bacterium]|nr:hypothetical protein [Jiangellaceae bacterium]
MRRFNMIGATALALSIVAAAPAVATECVNASKKDQAAGAQIVFGSNDEVLFVTQGLQNRLDQGLVDPDTGEGFHGLIAFDFDGDGQADVSTWVGVGPDGEEIPLEAQLRGPACRGLTNIGIYFEQCLGA